MPRLTTARRSRHSIVAVALLGACLSAVGCSGATPDLDAALVRTRMWVNHARFPVAPVALPGGGLLYGERLTGRVRHVGADGTLAPEPVATVSVVGAVGDQRGLVGLARSRDRRLFASWTGADRRLVVGELTTGDARPPRVVWAGPASADRANGGTLVFDRRGRLLVGIGDLLGDRTLDRDPGAPNRKVLALDPDAGDDQMPAIVSTGWNNPYALVDTAAGVPWVADNAGGRAPERIGRADRPAAASARMRRDGETLAPSALTEVVPGRLGVCGYVSGRLDEYRIRGGGAIRTGRVIARPCRLGTTVLTDGRLVTLTLHAIWRSTSSAASQLR